MKEIIFDAEFNGLFPDKMHCLSASVDRGPTRTTGDMDDANRFVRSCTDTTSVFIGHNICRFDLPVLHKLTKQEFHILSINCIDTLAISWYLYPKRARHGLEEWGEFFGIPKVRIDDWENLTQEEYIQRCERDVEINTKLWEHFKSLLLEMYGTEKEVYRVCRYLTFKLKCAQLAEESQWKVNVPQVRKNLAKLLWDIRAKTRVLKAEMPRVKQYRTMKKPKKMYKKNFDLTSIGEKWYNILRSEGLSPETEEVQVLTGTEEPNPGSSTQVKDWLLTLGWEPCTHKTGANGEVPQLKNLNDKELTPSVLKLAQKYPAVKELEGLYTMKHRADILKGFLRHSLSSLLKAEIAGFTNTLRMKHSAPLVNLPSVFSAYGEYIRPTLVAREGKILCGSDMSGLEDRTKQHYMMDYDPKYVEEMNVPGFDPHLDIGLQGGLLTEQDVEDYKNEVRVKEIKPVRHKAKTTNYTCTYGGFPPKIAKSADIPLEEAKILWEAYWKRNWSIRKIAEDQATSEFNELTWIWNPVSKMWYWLKHEKDRFSTLNQGTGSYCFDTWMGFVLQDRPQLTGQFHDEIILEINPEEKEEVETILHKAIQEVNSYLGMKRELEVDVQFGDNYGEIH